MNHSETPYETSIPETTQQDSGNTKPGKPRLKKSPESVVPIRKHSNTVHWYALYTAPRAEKKVAQRFADSGIEHYLPIQKVMRKWSDRMKEVEVPVVNGYIFVHISELQFKSVLNTYGAIQFVREFGKPVPIPDKQLARLRFMVDNADGPVDFSLEDLTPGTPISIIRGPMQGLVGELKEIKGKHHVVIRLDKFGCALTTVQLSFVTPLTKAQQAAPSKAPPKSP
jgi:transcription termination/antitermination protein NusG